jgi:hypothetical protein
MAPDVFSLPAGAVIQPDLGRLRIILNHNGGHGIKKFSRASIGACQRVNSLIL